jgi:hypothetical protein
MTFPKERRYVLCDPDQNAGNVPFINIIRDGVFILNALTIIKSGANLKLGCNTIPHLGYTSPGDNICNHMERYFALTLFRFLVLIVVAQVDQAKNANWPKVTNFK